LRRNFQSSLLECNALKVFCNCYMSYEIARYCLRGVTGALPLLRPQRSSVTPTKRSMLMRRL
jgi:hypothetical protein